MTKINGERRSDEEVERDIAETLGLPLTPRGKSLYRAHRTVHAGIAFAVFWAAVMTLFAQTLRTTPLWTVAFVGPSLWYLWYCFRRPYAELMLCVVDGRLVASAIHIRNEHERPRAEVMRQAVRRVSDIDPVLRVARKFPSDIAAF